MDISIGDFIKIFIGIHIYIYIYNGRRWDKMGYYIYMMGYNGFYMG